MAIGLGQILGMGLLSQFMGGGKGLLNDKEPEQPTQTASNNTNQFTNSSRTCSRKKSFQTN